MAINLSKSYGIPASLKTGRLQHISLSRQLKSNDLLFPTSNNRGYLTLVKKGNTYQNLLFKTRPKKTKSIIKSTKV